MCQGDPGQSAHAPSSTPQVAEGAFLAEAAQRVGSGVGWVEKVAKAERATVEAKETVV